MVFSLYSFVIGNCKGRIIVITQPFKAIGAFFQALPMMLSSGLRLFILAPLLANFLLMALIYMVAISYIGGLVDYIMGYLPDWMSFVSGLFYVIFTLVMAAVMFYSFSMGVNILAAPFMAFLAEKVEERETGKTFDDALTMSSLMATIGRSIQRELQKILYFVPRFVLLLLLSFIPLVNFITPILLLLFSAWMLALQYMDYSFDNNKVSFHEMRMALRTKPLLCWSFGGIVMLALMVPFFNLFVMPVAVVAATLLWISVFRPQYGNASLSDRVDGSF